MTTKPVLGISGCLTGSAVRFDGGHKRMGFVMDVLAQWVNFRPVCPEMAIGGDVVDGFVDEKRGALDRASRQSPAQTQILHRRGLQHIVECHTAR